MQSVIELIWTVLNLLLALAIWAHRFLLPEAFAAVGQLFAGVFTFVAQVLVAVALVVVIAISALVIAVVRRRVVPVAAVAGRANGDRPATSTVDSARELGE